MSCCAALGDLDDLLAYKTFKTVKVRHRWLGGVYYGTMVAILLYTGLYAVWLKEGYVKEIDFYGAVRSTIHEPAAKTMLPDSPYCNASASPIGSFASRLPCVFPDMMSGLYAKVTSGDDGALMVGTRVSMTHEERNESCGAYDYTCDPWITAVPKTSTYIGGLENSTIVIQNAVSKATQELYSGSADKLQIIDSFDADRPVATVHSTNTGRSFQVLRQPYGDQFTVAQLLDVVGIDLDAVFSDPTAGGANASVRLPFHMPLRRADRMRHLSFFIPSQHG